MGMLEEVRAKLLSLGLTNVFIGDMPDTPDECVAIYETGGEAPVHGFGTLGIQYETLGLQVVARGPRPGPGVTNTYTSPHDRATVAYAGLTKVECATLDAPGSPPLSSAYYHWIHATSGPLGFGKDENKRTMVSCNFLCEKEPSA